MTWDEKLKENERILLQLYEAIGSNGHGKLTVVFNQSSGKIEITPEPTFRDVAEFENYKAILR